MRTLLALLVLGSVNAFACPDLTGDFTCTYNDGSTELIKVTQENRDGVTYYSFGDELTPADNVVYTVPDDETLKQGTFRAWCDDDVTLKAELVGKYYDAGQFYGDLTMLMSYTLDNGNLKDVTTGSLKNDNGEYPINNELVCTRNAAPQPAPQPAP